MADEDSWYSKCCCCTSETCRLFVIVGKAVEARVFPAAGGFLEKGLLTLGGLVIGGCVLVGDGTCIPSEDVLLPNRKQDELLLNY